METPDLSQEDPHPPTKRTSKVFAARYVLRKCYEDELHLYIQASISCPASSTQQRQCSTPVVRLAVLLGPVLDKQIRASFPSRRTQASSRAAVDQSDRGVLADRLNVLLLPAEGRQRSGSSDDTAGVVLGDGGSCGELDQAGREVAGGELDVGLVASAVQAVGYVDKDGA